MDNQSLEIIGKEPRGNMIPVGYIFKSVAQRPAWNQVANVVDIYSVSGCISEFFTDYIKHWKHNGYWFFNSPKAMEEIAREENIDLSRLTLFFYEVYDKEFDKAENAADGTWGDFPCEVSFLTNIELPKEKRFAGYDVVEFVSRNSPECSPLACNALAQQFPVNAHCLFNTFEEAKEAVESGVFHSAEPGPYRIMAVYVVDFVDGFGK